MNADEKHFEYVRKIERQRDDLEGALRLPMVLYAIGYISETAGDGGDHTEAQGKEADAAAKVIRALLSRIRHSEG